MRRISIILIVLIASLELAAIIFFINNQKNFNRLYGEKIDELNSLEYTIERYKEKFDQNIFTENTFLENINITDVDNETISLNELIDSPKLIYRFTEVSCRACVDMDLEILKQLGDSIGQQNIIIIPKFENISRMKAMFKAHSIRSPYYNFKDKLNLSIERDSITEPAFFFMLDKELRIRFAYKTDDAHNFSSPYFRRIILYFKNGL